MLCNACGLHLYLKGVMRPLAGKNTSPRGGDYRGTDKSKARETLEPSAERAKKHDVQRVAGGRITDRSAKRDSDFIFYDDDDDASDDEFIPSPSPASAKTTLGTHKYRGVRDRGNGRFSAEIRTKGDRFSLGSFPSAAEASAAYVRAAKALGIELSPTDIVSPMASPDTRPAADDERHESLANKGAGASKPRWEAY